MAEAAIVHIETSIATLDIALLRVLAPAVLIVDIDRLEIDAYEALRQVRFVLPDCSIAVFTGRNDAGLTRACHNAGANCLLSKDSSKAELARGLRQAIERGSFTDPRFN